VIGPAATVEAAMDLIEASASDGGLSAAVLDINLRGKAAVPLADLLADLGVPFVFSTGYTDACDRGAHKAAPILFKPFDPDSLLAILKNFAEGAGSEGAADCGLAPQKAGTGAAASTRHGRQVVTPFPARAVRQTR